MAVAMIGPKFYAWNRNGKPLAFGKLYTYQARTNTPKPTYQSEDQVVENTNPVILNGEGYANVYLDGAYKMVLKDDKDNEIWSSDPVSSAQPDEWVNCVSAEYVSPTKFKVYGNVTSAFQEKRTVRLDSNMTEYAYGFVEDSYYAGGETTVTLNVGVVTTALNSACVYVSDLNVTNLQSYTDLVFKKSSGNSPVEEMILEFNINPLAYSIGTILKTGATTWEYIDSTGPITIENFRAFDVVSVTDFLMKPDYAGTPQYDGNDNTRITATDNTDNLKAALIAGLSSDKAVYITKGHYGIIDGNIDIDLAGKTLTIVGDGDDSILDFFKEDTSHTSGVNRTDAQCILKLHNGKLKTKDIRVKATTNLNNVNGDNNPDNQPIIFYAAIWGIIGFDVDMELDNTTADHFNFVGFTTGGSVENKTKVIMNNCTGFRNVGSGFWWYYSDVTLTGGMFYRNGRPGTIHVGYGMTASKGCGDVIVTGGAVFKENYRKGVDTHEAENMFVTGCVFIDNRMYDCSFTSPNDSGFTNDYTFNFNTVIYGCNEEFIAEFDQAYINLGGSRRTIPKTFVQGEGRSSEVDSDRYQSVCHNTFYVKPGGQLNPSGLNAFIFGASICKFYGNDVNLAGFNVDTGEDYNSIGMFQSVKAGADWTFERNSITTPLMAYGGDLYNSSFFKFNNDPSIFRFTRNDLNIRDMMLFSKSGGYPAEMDVDGLNLRARDNDITIRDLKLNNAAGTPLTNATDWIVKKRFFLLANKLLDAENTFRLSDEVSFTSNASPYTENAYGRLESKIFRKSGSTALQERIATVHTIDTTASGGTAITLDINGVGALYQTRAISTYTADYTVKTDNLTDSAIAIYDAILTQVGSTNFYTWAMPIHAVNGLAENTFKVELISESFIGSDLIAYIDVA